MIALDTPSVLGSAVAELIGRGISREEIAKALQVKPGMVSQVKKGKSNFDDEKTLILAQMHGGYQGRDLLAMKHVEWLEREKGVKLDEILKAARSLSRRNRKRG